MRPHILSTTWVRTLIVTTATLCTVGATVFAQVPGAPPPGIFPPIEVRKPDLVVTRLDTGRARIDARGSVELAVLVVVRNQGTAAAGIFKVDVHYMSRTGGPYGVPFTVPGQADLWFPHTSAPLAAGDEVLFVGTLTFPPSVRHQRVALRAMADSTAGEEFAPARGWVVEWDETNNLSVPVKVELP